MSKRNEEIKLDINTNNTDYAVSLIKAMVGQVPMLGSLIGELITNFIPNQRVDRISKYLKILALKVSFIENEMLRDRFKTPGFIDLFEDSLNQAIRATSEERLKNIASIVKNSLTDDQVQYVSYKHLLSLLSQLNDIEVIILKFESLHPQEREHFAEKHSEVLTIPIAVHNSPQEEVDKSTIYKSYKEHLVRLDLLKPKFKQFKKGQTPEFDEKTGMPKAQGHNITPLGKLLIRKIDDFSEVNTQI